MTFGQTIVIPDSVVRNHDWWWPTYEKKMDKAFATFEQDALHDLHWLKTTTMRRRRCIQAGGHVGMFPVHLSGMFGEVLTFEPQRSAFEAMQLNLQDRDIKNVHAVCAALGDKNDETVQMVVRRSSGRWNIDAVKGTAAVLQYTIDALDLDSLDAIVLDVEGYEAKVLRGAAKTIQKYRPVIQVELLPRSRDEINAVLSGLGYKLVHNTRRDGVYVHK